MTDQTRIGDSDRAAAMAALQQHLTAGRIELGEFDDRSEIVARARTRADVAPVFADLPEPHALSTGARPAERPVAPIRRRGPRNEDPLFGRFGEVLVALSPFIALGFFLVFRVWWVWLLIPAAGAVVYGRNDRHRRCGR